jgi:hypothetical protein
VLDYQLNLYFQTVGMDRFLKLTSFSVPGTSKIVRKAANRKYDDAYTNCDLLALILVKTVRNLIPYCVSKFWQMLL